MDIDVQVQNVFERKNPGQTNRGMVTGVTSDISCPIKRCLMRRTRPVSWPYLWRTLAPATTTGFSLQARKNGPPLITDDGNQDWLFSRYRQR